MVFGRSCATFAVIHSNMRSGALGPHLTSLTRPDREDRRGVVLGSRLFPRRLTAAVACPARFCPLLHALLRLVVFCLSRTMAAAASHTHTGQPAGPGGGQKSWDGWRVRRSSGRRAHTHTLPQQLLLRPSPSQQNTRDARIHHPSRSRSITGRAQHRTAIPGESPSVLFLT